MSFPRDTDYVGISEARVLRECDDTDNDLAFREALTRLARWEPQDWDDIDPA